MRLAFGTALVLALLHISTQPVASAPPADYPARPIRVVVPNAPGSTTDLLGRIVFTRMSERLGRQLVVDNRPGAGGTLGMEIASRAAADGYTVTGVAASMLTITPHIYRKLAYDALRDFDPVVLVATSTNVLVSHPSVPVRSVAELIAFAKRRPGQLTYASSGNGTTPHLSGELFKHVAGIDLVHIPYKGAGPAINDLLGGHVALAFVTLTSVAPHIRANRLRALALTSAKRSALMPDIPTLKESGIDVEADAWMGLIAPGGTPAPVIAKIHDAVVEAITTPAAREKLATQLMEPIGNSPAQFRAVIEREVARWAPVIKAIDLKIN